MFNSEDSKHAKIETSEHFEFKTQYNIKGTVNIMYGFAL